MYHFIGMSALDADGAVINVSVYCDEGDDPKDAVTEARKAIERLGLTPATAGQVGGGGSAAPANANVVIEDIEMVVKRTQVNLRDGKTTKTPAIELYPKIRRGPNGVYGKWRVATKYLNTPEDIAEFEAVTGIKLDDIPLYQGDQAPQRNPDLARDWEFMLPAPVKIEVVKKPGKDKDGNAVERKVFSKWVTPVPAGN